MCEDTTNLQRAALRSALLLMIPIKQRGHREHVVSSMSVKLAGGKGMCDQSAAPQFFPSHHLPSLPCHAPTPTLVSVGHHHSVIYRLSSGCEVLKPPNLTSLAQALWLVS